MNEVATVDRAKIRSMVEDAFRSLLTLDPTNTAGLVDAVRRQDEHFSTIASLMPQSQRDAFMRVVVEERQFLLDEQKRNPVGLRQRLGVQPVSTSTVVLQEESMGKMAAKTAVRAGIWATIFAIFFNN